MVIRPLAPVSQPELANLERTQLDDSAPCVPPPPGTVVVRAGAEVLKGRWEHRRPRKTQACNGLLAASAHVPLIEASSKPRVGKGRTTHNENVAKIGIQVGVNNRGQLFHLLMVTNSCKRHKSLKDG